MFETGAVRSGSCVVEGVAADELARLPIERLEAELVGLAAQSASAMYRWLCLVAEFDRREGAGSWGMASTAHWVAWRCALGPRTAREHVRVARRLGRLALVSERFARGELTYAKVRAICRVATAENEAVLVGMAEDATAAQLERVVRSYRPVDDDGDQAGLGPEDPSEVSVEWGDDGRGRITGSLSALDTARVQAALRAGADALFRAERESGSAEPSAHGGCENGSAEPPSSEGQSAHGGCENGSAEPPSSSGEGRVGLTVRQRAAAVLVGAADAVLGRVNGSDDRYLVLVHVDAERMRDGDPQPGYVDGGPPLSAPQVCELLGSHPAVLLVNDGDGNPLFMGRATKELNRQMRRALRARDGGACRFPGCTNTLKLHGHHVAWWVRDEGPSDIWNVVSLCPRHHRLIHSGSFRVEADGRGGFAFYRSSDGAELPASPPLPAAGEAVEESNRAAGVAVADQPWAGAGERLTSFGLDTLVTRIAHPDGRQPLPRGARTPATR